MICKKKIKNILITVIFVIISIILSGCMNGQQNFESTETPEPPKYTPGTEPDQDYLKHKEDLFTISYPKSWSVEDKENYLVDVVFKAPYRDENVYTFLPTVNVSIVDISEEDSDMTNYIDEVVKSLEDSYDVFNLSSQENAVYGDINGTNLIYNASIKNYKVKIKQFIGIKKDKIYMLTYVSDQDNYDAYLETAEKIMNSFEAR